MHGRLRVLHVDPERGWGGGEEQVLGLARHLRNAGHLVSVAAHPGGPLWRALRAAEIDVHPLAVRNGFDFRAVRALRALAAGADIVHLHTARAHALALWLGRDGEHRVVTRRMDYQPRPRFYARLLYNRRVDRVVAISERIRVVLEEAGVEPTRISVIPSGVEIERFTAAEGAREDTRRVEWCAAPTDIVVLVVGALVLRKGHAVLLEAARELAARGMRLQYAFCGEGERRSELERQVMRLGLAGTVHFMGRRDDVPRLLAGADLVAMPSLHEGLGVAALEAMAAARPLIASRTGGLVEVLREGETGSLVGPGDVRGLADALEAAVRDPVRAKRYGMAGQRRVATEFSMQAMAARNEALYATLVA